VSFLAEAKPQGWLLGMAQVAEDYLMVLLNSTELELSLLLVSYARTTK
jgi:hypothetical protein